MIRIFLNKAVPEVRCRERLTTGMSSVVFCEFSFSEEWEGLRRFAEFTDGTFTRTVELTESVCAVPHELLSEAGHSVSVGVYGTNGESMVLPSVFVRLGEVEKGAQGDSDPSLPLTPSLFDRFVTRAEQARLDSETAREAREVVESYLSETACAKMHRSIYRGANLGSALTAGQLAAVRDGSFEGLYIGDYWTIGGVNYRIADMDYWYGVGKSEPLEQHHLVIVPDACIYSECMEKTNTTKNGYAGSYMKISGLSAAVRSIGTAFGGNVLSREDCFISDVQVGRPANIDWQQTKVDLMNEIMLYGTHLFAATGDGSALYWNYTSERTQLALFRLDPLRINCSMTYWLRDTVDGARFAAHHRHGMAYCVKATNVVGVRPVFAIG